MDWRSSDIQAIVDIKPTKITFKTGNPDPINFMHRNKTMEVSQSEAQVPNNLFQYFGLPHPKKCLPGVLTDLNEIVTRVRLEFDGDNELFELIHSIEGQQQKTKDPVIRVMRVLNYVKTAKGRLRDVLSGKNIQEMDLLAEEARYTGNWSRYLRRADVPVRSGRRRR